MSKKRKFKIRTPRGFEATYGKKHARLLAKRIKKLEKDNLKTVDIHENTDAGADIFTTPAVVSLNGMTGDQVILNYLSIQLKGLLQQDTADTGANHLARIVIVMDLNNQDTGTTPVWGDVFATTDVFSLRTYDENEIDKQMRFKILFDKTYYVSKVTNGLCKEKVLVNTYIKLNKSVKFSGTSNPAKNGLYLMFMSTAASTVMDFAYHTRIRFTKDD